MELKDLIAMGESLPEEREIYKQPRGRREIGEAIKNALV
jgi:hypothetical protein